MSGPLAKDLMTPDVVTVPPETPVMAIARLLADRGISAVPVVDAAGKVLGIVTEADLIRRLAGEEDKPASWFGSLFSDPASQAERYARTHGVTARDLMTEAVVSVTPDTTAAHVAHVMEDKKVRRGVLTFILAHGIGRSFIAHGVAAEEVQAFIESELTGNGQAR